MALVVPEGIRRPVRRVARTNYRTYRWYRSARIHWLYRGVRRRSPLLVFQMSKVGSTAVAEALRACAPRRDVIHLHRLSPAALAAIDRRERDRFERTRAIDAEYLRCRFVVRRLESIRRHGPLEIVTMVRDPVARGISSYLQLLSTYHPRFARQVRDEPLTEEMVARARTNLLEGGWLRDPAEWFREELQPVTGIDVLARPFDRDRGFTVFDGDDARVLLMRSEDLDRCFEAAISTFLGIGGATLERANEGRSKSYSQLYQALTADPGIPPEELDRVYDSSVVRTFYTDDEVAGFRRRWSCRRDVGEPRPASGTSPRDGS